MTLEQFLQKIQPNLTIVAALFAFLILFIRFFWFFFTYENTLRGENIIRLQELITRQSELQIVQPLQNELEKSIELGYKYAISLFYPKVFNSATQEFERRLIENDPAQLNSILGKENKEIIKDLSGQSVAQKTGADLFIFLEKRYQITSLQIGKYSKAKIFCQRTWLAFILLSLLAILGIFILIFPATNTLLLHFWIFSSLCIIVFCLYSFICLFYYKNLLNREWERIKLYGNE